MMDQAEQSALDAMLEQLSKTLSSDSDLQQRICAKCGEDVTYWLSPCAEPGCPAVKQDS
jgi:hypothetical protein